MQHLITVNVKNLGLKVTVVICQEHEILLSVQAMDLCYKQDYGNCAAHALFA